ncbi:hypothetical protein D1AOALGA4SA_11370 [Olavius algarvensis Delta 1 endosymbiont]|nr:hypothetical protein D1AOALGA4SA_11370 [Olavius algarvensis Delta 1 endosymbiont]
MSYDLYFTEPKIERDDFIAYFHDRQNYEVSDMQVFYQNEDTGVYFLIDYNESADEDPEAIESTASLNLNYYRPHFFGLEAVDEISALIDHFQFSIHDPQNAGMADGPFSKEGFLRAWNHGNEFGYSAILQGDNAPDKVWTIPTEQLESIWKWNYKKDAVQESFREDSFVPRVFFMAVGGKVVSVTVWPDAISELIPRVDFLVIDKDELAPRSLFRGRKKDQVLLPFDELAFDFEPYVTSEHSLLAYTLPAPQVPENLRKRIRDLKQTGITGEGISMDQVLNAEIVTKFKKG